MMNSEIDYLCYAVAKTITFNTLKMTQWTIPTTSDTIKGSKKWHDYSTVITRIQGDSSYKVGDIEKYCALAEMASKKYPFDVFNYQWRN